MSLVNKVSMIILMEHDLAAGVEFYKKLGFKLKFHLKDKWAEFELGDIKLGLCPTSEEPLPRRSGIVLEVADVKKLHAENKDWINFISEIHEAVHGIMVSMQDPGGNVLDLYQPTPERVQELIKKTAHEDAESCGVKEGCC